MKITVLIAVLLGSLPMAHAATESTKVEVAYQRSPKDAVVDTKSLYGFYSMADTVSFRGETTSGSLNGSGAFGAGFRHTLVRLMAPGYSFGLAYESKRTFLNDSTANLLTSKPEISMILPEFNLTYGLSQQFYLMGGLNYPYALNWNYDPATMNTFYGLLGTQLGAALLMTPDFAFEFLFRTVNYSISSKTASVDSARLWGPMVRGVYNFP